MDKPNLLFLDDRSERLHVALEQYSNDFNVTLVCTVNECLRKMAFEEFDVISLDHDLNGGDFENPKSCTSGMEIVRYLEETGWPQSKRKPYFYVHSSNIFAASAMVARLNAIDLYSEWRPFGWKKYQRGVVAGTFDVIHVGYVRLLETAKKNCHLVTVLLHDKPNQIFPLDVRKEILLGMRSVDEIRVYKTEDELTEILENGKYEVRIVGSDHIGKSSRPDLNIETIYHERNHKWSATKFKSMVYKFMKDK